jgi:hypothetical protein
MPRSFNAKAMAARVVTPSCRSVWITGKISAARARRCGSDDGGSSVSLLLRSTCRHRGRSLYRPHHNSLQPVAAIATPPMCRWMRAIAAWA